jgi:hypothetical protein
MMIGSNITHSFLFINIVPPELERKVVVYPLDYGNGVKLADTINKFKCGGVTCANSNVIQA